MLSTHMCWAIVPAAGIGRRINADKPKQYLTLGNKTILEHTLSCLLSHPLISKVVVVLNPHDNIWPSLKLPFSEKIMTAVGGQQRCHSVLNGLVKLQDLAQAQDWILVHDAARPCLRHEDIDFLLQKLADHPVGGLLGTPIRDTLKQVDNKQQVIATLDRHNVWQALTPQLFRYAKLTHALSSAITQQLIITDEASAIELQGEQPLMIEGREDNIKITYPYDLVLAERYLKR